MNLRKGSRDEDDSDREEGGGGGGGEKRQSNEEYIDCLQNFMKDSCWI
jgi:hypothetical protein